MKSCTFPPPACLPHAHLIANPAATARQWEDDEHETTLPLLHNESGDDQSTLLLPQDVNVKSLVDCWVPLPPLSPAIVACQRFMC
eukprot:scaffold229505_cov36-Cyclotella_meneghiniana.AAC.1